MSEQPRSDQPNVEELERLLQSRTLELQAVQRRLEEQIAERRAAEDRLRHDAFHDLLTGLANRALLMDRLRASASRLARRSDYRFAVLFLDIDNFKVINDSLGHLAGDTLLVDVARRLMASTRDADSVTRFSEGMTARLGGDEFVVLLEDIKRPNDAAIVAERIQAQLAPPFRIDDHEIVVTASIGIALSGAASRSADELLRDADIAMYRAKAAGKAQHAIFDEAMHAAAMARLQLENDLRRAIEQQQFILEYQPIVDLDATRICGFEALTRWIHPQRGVVSPTEFIPVAEETGLIVPLGKFVLHEVCRHLRTWNAGRSAGQRLSASVNISRRQVVEPAFLGDVCSVLRQTGVDGSYLNFEITESMIMENPASIISRLRQIRDMDIELHMDDFGTGQSSLGSLRGFPFDVLKIDRAFVTAIGKDRKYTAIIEAIITLAHNLDMKVVAEGVETREQLVQLRRLGCDFGQGFLFSRPVDADKALALVQRYEPLITHA